jgi:hypothetical protein
MQDEISNEVEALTITCRRCEAEASVRIGREYLCPRCALADPESDGPMVVCDLCDRESLVRVGERFLCGGCAMGVLRLADLSDLPGSGASDALDVLDRAGEEVLIAREMEFGILVREGAMRLVDAATLHHRALVRSLKRARDVSECVERVEAGAALFNLWAFSFDARLEELERERVRRREEGVRPNQGGHDLADSKPDG